MEHLLAWCCRCVAAAPIRPYLHLSGWNWFLFCPLQTAQTAEWMGAASHAFNKAVNVCQKSYKTWTTFEGKQVWKLQDRSGLSFSLTYCHMCAHTSLQPSPLSVWLGHMLMLTPCGEKAGAISVCVDVNLDVCVLWSGHRRICLSCVYVLAHSVCVSRGGHNEMGGWAGASHH